MNSATFVQSRTATVALTALVAIGISCLLIRVPGGEVICLAGVVGLLLAVTTRFDLTSIAVAFVVSQPLVQFLKRAIFLLGSQPPLVYYALQGVTTALFLLALGIALRRLRWRTLAPSGKLLLAYLAVALVTTLFAPGGASLLTRSAAVATAVLPISAFYVGAALGLPGLLRVGRAMLPLVYVSVAYGLIQFIGGPTVVEEAWAAAMGDVSIQARKVARFLDGGPAFRPFSFYADPWLWGLFLINASVAIFLLRVHGWISRRTVQMAASAVLFGLVLTLCRSPLLGFVAMVGTYQILRLRSLRRPWFVASLVPVAFALVILGGNYMLSHQKASSPAEDPVLARFTTVGTIGARTGAWDMLQFVVRANPLVGQGWAYSPGKAVAFSEFEATDLMLSHNFVVELVLYAGLPGLVLFTLFYLRWLREARMAMATDDSAANRSARWVVAFSLGLMVFGLFAGWIFMSFEYFLILGAFSDYARRLRQPERTSGAEPQVAALEA